MKEYRNQFPNVDPEVFWVVDNNYLPVQAQGFLGVWEGREDQYYFPQVGFTTSRDFIYTTYRDACREAYKRVQKQIDKFETKLAQINAIVLAVEGKS